MIKRKIKIHIIDIKKIRVLKKMCPKCNKLKMADQFYPEKSRKYGLSSWCKEEKKKEYQKNRGQYIYKITIDGEVYWIGSTSNMKTRISNHRNIESNGHFVYMCENNGISLDGKNVEVWVCDTRKLGYNLTDKDRKYYEHRLVRYYRYELKKPLLNIIENSEYKERERYIDEIVMGGFIDGLVNDENFFVSKYKIILD